MSTLTEEKLIEACRKNNIVEVKEVLRTPGFDPSFDKNSAIHISMLYSSVGALELLLKDSRMKYDVEELVKIADGNTEVLLVLEKFRKREKCTEKPKDSKTESYENDCPICLDRTEDMFVMNPCKHAIHLSCANGMIKKECPICRVEVNNWPEEVEGKLNTNVANHREEVIREEQEVLRAQEEALRNVMLNPHPLLSMLANALMAEDPDDSFEEEQPDEENTEEENIPMPTPPQRPNFGAEIIMIPNFFQFQQNPARILNGPVFPVNFEGRRDLGTQDLGFMNFMSDAELAQLLANENPFDDVLPNLEETR